MRIHLVCVEDGLIALGFRKMTALVKSIHPNTHTYYVPLSRRSMWKRITATEHDRDARFHARAVAEEIAHAEIVAFSSMSDYADFVKAIIAEVREINPHAYVVWGGIHPIIVPEDAVGFADAVCTGEGEIAFQEFFEKFAAGRDFTDTRNFWFRREGEVIKNGFLPLMTGEEMSAQPTLEYASGEEMLFTPERGFTTIGLREYLTFNNLGYNTIWSIGCPFRCTYCGNTKFILNDPKYRKLRHLTVDAMMSELERAVKVHPHLNSVLFHDDSFMALPRAVLRDFADAYKERVGIPFCVFGVIPNYVRDEKFDILVDAGMNRVRMGIQSGSARILEFYRRPSPPEKIMAATEVIGKYTPYMIPPAYDIIVDNPIETKEDIDATLRLLFEMPRPFTLNLFSLRVMPNTDMAEQFEELAIRPEDMAEGYFGLAPTLANALVYLMAILRPPRFLFEWWIRKAKPFHEAQKHYPKLNQSLRMLYFMRRGTDHLRNMDFGHSPGYVGWILWKLGVIGWWKQHVLKPYPSGGLERPSPPSLATHSS
jgi:anaerobic magnesium-protoporphyrin IX monomethyl ester cyclase